MLLGASLDNSIEVEALSVFRLVDNERQDIELVTVTPDQRRLVADAEGCPEHIRVGA